jgi:siroheme synthase
MIPHIIPKIVRNKKSHDEKVKRLSQGDPCIVRWKNMKIWARPSRTPLRIMKIPEISDKTKPAIGLSAENNQPLST